MKVQEILNIKNRDPITVNPNTKITEAMDLLIVNKISCLPVISGGGELKGIISDKDIFKKVHTDPTGFANCQVGDLMTSDVIVGLGSDEISYIAGVMTKNRIRHVPVLESNKLIGMISVGDVVKTQIEDMEIENRYLRQYIDGGYPQ